MWTVYCYIILLGYFSWLCTSHRPTSLANLPNISRYSQSIDLRFMGWESLWVERQAKPQRRDRASLGECRTNSVGFRNFISYRTFYFPSPHLVGLQKRDFLLLLELLCEVWIPRKLSGCYTYSIPRFNFTCPRSIRFCTHPSVWNFTHLSNHKCITIWWLFPDTRQSYPLYKLAMSFCCLSVWLGSGSKWSSMEIWSIFKGSFLCTFKKGRTPTSRLVCVCMYVCMYDVCMYVCMYVCMSVCLSHPALYANGSCERKVSNLHYNPLKFWIFVILFGGLIMNELAFFA
jgi:hypothetical protein